MAIAERPQQERLGEDEQHEHQQHAPHQPITTADADLDYLRKQVLALQTVIIRKGIATYAEILDEVHKLETVDHSLGARVVAHAWADPAFKERLLRDGKAACAELGIEISGYDELQVVENSDTVHHVVVCTTCSCVPSPLHGITPDWYKSTAYRTRVVQEPRAVLAEFGLNLPPSVDVRVVDTSKERRCVVLPQRPPLSEGLTEAELAELVTRDSLFGTGQAVGPVGA